ncbi:MAG: T9SS type A sorting domain-containing protein [Ignavibacteriales bacterium]|nr:T9SS type A sorting domain-containing protein [Ignavibacteriales bacterium]
MNTIKIVDSGDSAKIYVNNELIHNVIISPDWRQDGYIEIGANGETDLTAFDDIVISGIINTSVKTIENTTPTTFRLQQNYPNPFNPITKIKYQIPEDTRVSFKIFNVLGEEIKTIVNEYQSAGYKEITFNGEDLPSGFYFYRLQTDKFTDVKKMLLVK